MLMCVERRAATPLATATQRVARARHCCVAESDDERLGCHAPRWGDCDETPTGHETVLCLCSNISEIDMAHLGYYSNF